MHFNTIFAPMIFEETARAVAESAMLMVAPGGGHVIGKHIRHMHHYYPPITYGPSVSLAPGSLEYAMKESAIAFAEAQTSLFEEICEDAGAKRVSVHDAPDEHGITASWVDEEGNIPGGMGRSARVADLSIACVPGKEGGSREIDLIENLLVSSGKPVLLVPRTGLNAYPSKILVCWDGSRSGARALEASLPILKAATSVRMTTLNDVDFDTPELDEAASFLRMHGVSVIAEPITKVKGSVAKRILAEADNHDADLIVMGGYSHRRFDEAIFGGVTRHILDHSDRALLMAH